MKQQDNPANSIFHCDIDMARRLERAEGRSNADFVEARARAYPEIGCKWIDVASTLAMFDGVDSPCTQTFGLGIFEPVTNACLTKLEKFFHLRRSQVFHEVCPLANSVRSVEGAENAGDSMLSLLNSRGYDPIEVSNVMVRSIEPGIQLESPGKEALGVRQMAPGEEPLWAQICARGWSDVAPGLEEYLKGLEEVNRYRRNAPCFFAEKEGDAIATAALCLQEGIALLAGACTVPEARRQGAQLALLDYRLRFAADNGCDIAMVVTEPGSSSQRNAERHGFRVAYTRTKWQLSQSDPSEATHA